MGIHCMIFLTIGNLVSPTISLFSIELKGRIWAAPNRKNLPASGSCGDGDLVEGGVGNLIGFNLWCSLNHSRQDLRHFGIRFAVVGFRVLSVIPQTDCEPFRSAWDDERDFVLESLLFSKQRKNVLFDRLGELRKAIGLQLHGYSACKHEILLGSRCQRGDSDNHYWFRHSEDSLSPLTIMS